MSTGDSAKTSKANVFPHFVWINFKSRFFSITVQSWFSERRLFASGDLFLQAKDHQEKWIHRRSQKESKYLKNPFASLSLSFCHVTKENRLCISAGFYYFILFLLRACKFSMFQHRRLAAFEIFFQASFFLILDSGKMCRRKSIWIK